MCTSVRAVASAKAWTRNYQKVITPIHRPDTSPGFSAGSLAAMERTQFKISDPYLLTYVMIYSRSSLDGTMHGGTVLALVGR